MFTKIQTPIKFVTYHRLYDKWVLFSCGYLLTVCRLDFRLWVLATRDHTRGVTLPLLTLTSLDSRVAGGLLSCGCCMLALATLWCPCRDAWFTITKSVKVTSAVPPDSRGIAFWRKCSSISYIEGKHKCWTRQWP